MECIADSTIGKSEQPSPTQEPATERHANKEDEDSTRCCLATELLISLDTLFPSIIFPLGRQFWRSTAMTSNMYPSDRTVHR